MNIPPDCLPGQILIRNAATGEWECVWPEHGPLKYAERRFLWITATLAVALLGLSTLLVVFATGHEIVP